MGTRFFSATAYVGKLFVQGVNDRGPWDARLLVYWTRSKLTPSSAR